MCNWDLRRREPDPITGILGQPKECLFGGPFTVFYHKYDELALARHNAAQYHRDEKLKEHWITYG